MRQTKDLLSKEIRFGTIICPRSNIEIISEVFLDFVRVNKQFYVYSQLLNINNKILSFIYIAAK